eukprot:scaffold256062_cov31-Tisochrysis_lutea.AAC.1
MPMTVKTPPMIAQVDVTNLYAGIRCCCTTMEMGERSYLKSIDGGVPSGAEYLLEWTVYL